MKNFLKIALLALFVAPVFAANANTEPVDPAEYAGPKLTVQLEFGRKSLGCEKFGFCKWSVDFEWDVEVNSNGFNGAKGNAWIQDGKLVINFDRSSMSQRTLSTYFANDTFIVEEDYVISGSDAAALGVSSYTIKAGRYQVEQSRSNQNDMPIAF